MCVNLKWFAVCYYVKNYCIVDVREQKKKLLKLEIKFT